MSEHRFDLVGEPWLPCLAPDGTEQAVGLREALLRAHELRELWHPSPLVTVSLHRLLLAILHRALLGPTGMAAWADLWRRGRWEPDPVGAYLDRWRHRFDLFDRERPFYQTTALAEGEGERTVWALAQEAASGNNATLFDHRSNAAPRPMAPAEAARYLVAQQAAAIGFGKSLPFYFSDAPLVRGYSVLAHGDTLFETLALNLMPYNAERPIPWRGEDLPTWEQVPPTVPDDAGTPPRGYVDYLTWQSRRVRLTREDGPALIRRCQIRQNLKLRGDLLDPFKCYVVDPARGRYPRSLNPDRVFWRDSHALLQQSGPTSRRPELFNTLARVDDLRRAAAIVAQPAYGFGAFGFATDPGKAASVVLWRQERLPLPLTYLGDEALVARLRAGLDLAEEVGRVLRGAARVLAAHLLAPGADGASARQPDPKDVQHLVDHLALGRRYWSRLEEPFARFLVGLPQDRGEDEEGEADYGRRELPAWAAELRRVGRAVFAETTRGLDGSGRSLKAVARARGAFEGRLHKVVAPYLLEEVPDERAV